MQTQIIKKISGSLIMIFLLSLTFIPVFTFSAPSKTNPVGNTGLTYECGDNPAPGQPGTPTAGNCDFADLMAAVKHVVNQGTIIALAISVIVIAWAGFKYMISGDNASERTKANQMLLKILYGMAFIIAAWLIVTLITSALLRPGLIQFGP